MSGHLNLKPYLVPVTCIVRYVYILIMVPEAEYTFEQQKQFIPLMMQRHYKPDGWLGLLLGSKFYINFDGKYEFEEAYEMLLRELKGRGKGGQGRAAAVMGRDQGEFYRCSCCCSRG